MVLTGLTSVCGISFFMVHFQNTSQRLPVLFEKIVGVLVLPSEHLPLILGVCQEIDKGGQLVRSVRIDVGIGWGQGLSGHL